MLKIIYSIYILRQEKASGPVEFNKQHGFDVRLLHEPGEWSAGADQKFRSSEEEM